MATCTSSLSVYLGKKHDDDKIDKGRSHGGEYLGMSFDKQVASFVDDSDYGDAVDDSAQHCTQHYTDLQSKVHSKNVVKVKKIHLSVISSTIM